MRTLHDQQPTSDVPPADAEALIREARHLRRRRWLISLVVVLAAGGTGLGVALTRSPFTSPSATRAGTRTSPAAVPTAVGPPLKAPYGLAVSPTGDLYIVDTGRDQVLRRLSTGKFQVVAGDGRRGFAGDGGPANRAELDLEPDSGIAVARNGTLYIADSGNDRVRAVSPNGVIHTVAGDGKSAGQSFILHTTPAGSASLGAPAGLAIGPNGDLYIAAANVVRLTDSHLIEWVAGGGDSLPCGSVFCNPAGEADFNSPDQLAFDRAGDLYVSGTSYGLLEITSGGRLRYLGQARGDGAPEALAEAPDGTVVQAGRNGLTRLPANGKVAVPKSGPGDTILAPGDGIRGDIDNVLGQYKDRENMFIGGDGVAVGPNGAIYADTNVGNTFTAVSALVEVMPNGAVRALWKS